MNHTSQLEPDIRRYGLESNPLATYPESGQITILTYTSLVLAQLKKIYIV